VRLETLALWLAGGVPFVAYVVTMSGYAYWLDSGEFVAAAVQLDIAHPPGHPLSALFGSAIALLPLGSLSFRVALGQALASAGASVLHCRASAAALSGMELPPRVRWSLALFAAWLSALTYGIWFQAVRPEVYALQTLCTALVFERLARFAAQPAADDARPLLGAALALGLALTNHHLIGFLLVPAGLPALFRLSRARRVRSLAAALGLFGLALGTYLYLPLRAAAKPPANLGDPVDLQRFLWVVSARVYAHDMGSEAAQPLWERSVDVIALWVENFHALPTLLALLGLYVMLRHAGTRRAGLVCGLLLATDAGARAWLGPVRANPDILGYLAPGFLATGTLAAGFLGACFWLGERLQPVAALRLARWAPLVPLCALWTVPDASARSGLGHFAATDTFDEWRLRRLPSRALVLASTPQTVFRAWEVAAVERMRPDLTIVPLPFLRYPGAADAVQRSHPELGPLIRGYLANHDRLPDAELLQLAQQQPVFVELDTRVPPSAYSFLLPRGLLTQVASPPRPTSVAAPGAELATQRARLYDALGPDVHETETARQLLWIHYMNALHLGALGARELAQDELARARTLHPSDRRVQALARALAEEGPLDIRPFLKF
jgi:hypothetical protein